MDQQNPDANANLNPNPTPMAAQPMPPQGQPMPPQGAPGYQPPAYPTQPGYPQPQPGYPQPGYPQPGYPQPAPGYVTQPGYQPVPQAVPAYPPMGMGQPPLFGGIQYVYVADPMAELALCAGVEIKQQPQFLEAISGCEYPNRYFVFSKNPQGGMKLLFKCKEFSEFCARNCCPADVREFRMKIKHVAAQINLNEDFSTPFVDVFKPFKCTCCCFERPEMIVTFGAGNQPCGKIKQPFTCCDPKFEVKDNTGALKYTIHADCCQCGICCANSFCGKFSTANFQIYAGANITAPPVGLIQKKPANFSELVTSADSYIINFPPQATPQEKMLLIVAGLMVDYQYFEEKAGSNESSTTVRFGGY